MNSVLILIIIFIATMEVHAQILPAFGDERIGISIGSALKIGAGARATGMGRALYAS